MIVDVWLGALAMFVSYHPPNWAHYLECRYLGLLNLCLARFCLIPRPIAWFSIPLRMFQPPQYWIPLWLLALFSILAQWSSILVGLPSYPLKMSISMSTAFLVSLFIGRLFLRILHILSVARISVSLGVSNGCVGYLCLKTIWPTLDVLVSLIHTLWHL